MIIHVHTQITKAIFFSFCTIALFIIDQHNLHIFLFQHILLYLRFDVAVQKHNKYTIHINFKIQIQIQSPGWRSVMEIECLYFK